MTARVKPPSDLETRIRAAAAAGEWITLTKADEVPAALIANLVTVAANDVHAKGVQMRGATITGRLDLDDATVTRPLWLSDCALAEGVTFARASTRTVAIQDCTIDGGVQAFGARIEGILFLRSSTIVGMVSLTQTWIAGDLVCMGARLDGAGAAAFHGDRMKVAGGVFLNDGFTAKGEVRLLGADVAGTLDCRGARLDGNGGYALSGDRLRVRGSVFLNDGFTADGGVRLLGAEIAGDLNCVGAQLGGADGAAFIADGVTVKGDISLVGGFTAKGEVRLLGADISGDFSCTGARLDGKGDYALSADRMRVRGGVFMNNGFTTDGGVRLLGANIANNLDCMGARLDGASGAAFSADGVVVKGDVFLNGGFTANGEVRLPGADIAGDLICVRARLDGKGGDAFNADGIRVAGALFLRSGFSAFGTVRLDHAEVSVLCDDEAGWPAAGNLRVSGFVYKAIVRSAPLAAEDRLEWLGRQPADRYDPQPYEQLARVLKAQGHSRDARIVLMAKEKQRLRRGNVGWRSKLWGWGIAWPLVGFGYAPWRALIAALVVIALGAGIFSLAQRTEVMVPTKERVYMAGKGLPEQYPRFQPLVYSADIFLPIVDLQQDTYWIPSTRGEQRQWRQFVRGWMWFEIVAGWFLTVLFAAGVTGLVKRE